MSNKLHKIKNGGQSAGLEITGQLIEYLLAVVIAAVCIAVPLYAKDGYDQIGNAKFEIYRNILRLGLVPLLMLAALHGVFRILGKQKWQFSITDGFVLAYLFSTILATVLGGFYKDALWGAFGWNMGLLSQISFVLLYLFLSRFGKFYRPMLLSLCGVSVIVFLIGILHRLGVDPIGFYRGLSDSQMAEFLSTMGQATWYASFLIVILPIGIAVFLYTEDRIWKTVSGIYMVTGFCTLVTQNSDSAYFALAGFMLVFFWVSVETRERLRRFVAACILFLISGKGMSFLMRIDPNPALQYDFFTELILDSVLTWVLLGVCVVLYVVIWRRQNSVYPMEIMLRVRWIALAGVGAVIAGILGLIILQTNGLLPEKLALRLSSVSYFTWDETWGNGRGRIWSFAVKIFGEENFLHQLVGIGPDCLSSYVAANYSGEAELYWGQKVLTNAHNEWLNMLINGGILGLVSYAGIFVTAVRKFLRKDYRDVLLTGIAAAAVSYMAYNFFCYQQVCCTPFIFMLLGIGEYLCRNKK